MVVIVVIFDPVHVGRLQVDVWNKNVIVGGIFQGTSQALYLACMFEFSLQCEDLRLSLAHFNVDTWRFRSHRGGNGSLPQC